MTLAIIQARSGSQRLPRKVMLPLVGRSVLAHVVARVRDAVPNVVVAVPHDDHVLVEHCHWQALPYSNPAVAEADVLSRYYAVASQWRTDQIVRVTADCPFVDPQVLRDLIALFHRTGSDYVSVATGTPSYPFQGHRFPDGLDAEVFSLAMLRCAWANAVSAYQREHVTPFIWGAQFGAVAIGPFHSAQNGAPFRIEHLYADADYGKHRLTLDTQEDWVVIQRVYETLGPRAHWKAALDLLET